MSNNFRTLISDFANIQLALDRIEITPFEWAAEFDSIDENSKFGMLSYLHASSVSGKTLQESLEVKLRILQILNSNALPDQLLTATLIALQTVQLPEALSRVEELMESGTLTEVQMEIARIAVANQTNS